MGTFTVNNQIFKPDNNPLVGIRVRITLKPEGAYRTSDGAEFLGPLIKFTDSNGIWTTPLEDNANITPAGSYYEIEERIPTMYGGTKIHWVQLAGRGGTIYELRGITVPPPAAHGWSYSTWANNNWGT